MTNFDLLKAYDADQLCYWINEALFDSDLNMDDKNKLEEVVTSNMRDIQLMDKHKFTSYLCKLSEMFSDRDYISIYHMMNRIDPGYVTAYLDLYADPELVDEFVVSQLLKLINNHKVDVTSELSAMFEFDEDEIVRRLITNDRNRKKEDTDDIQGN